MLVTCIPSESEEKFAVLRQMKIFLLNEAGKVSDLSCKRDHSQAQGAVVLTIIVSIVITGSRKKMFIAMNRFQVTKGREADFETLWKSRDSRLNEMNGFVVFHLLRGPEREDHTLYSSHTVWASKQDFEDCGPGRNNSAMPTLSSFTTSTVPACSRSILAEMKNENFSQSRLKHSPA